MKERQPIDDLFRDKFKDFSLPVTEEMWNNIERGIRKNKFRILLPWILGGTGAILVATMFLFRDNLSRENDPEAKDVKNGAIESTALQNASADDLIADNNIYNNLNVKSIEKEENISKLSLNRSIESKIDTDSEILNPSNKDELLQPINAAQIRNESLMGGTPAGEDISKMLVTGENVGAESSDIITADVKSIRDVEFDMSLAPRIGTQNFGTESELNSMALPVLRKVRDRNCDDDAFSSGRMFLELSYGLQKGNLIFSSTGTEFNEYTKLRKDGEIWKNGTHIQALIGFQIGRNMYFKTGLSYNRVESDYYFIDQVNKIKRTDSIWNGSEWLVNEREIDIVISGTNSYTFVDIPLLVSYGMQFNKLGLALTTGPMINLSFSREGQLPNLIGQGIDLSDGLWNEREIYRKTAGLNWFTSLQVSYQTYKNVELFIEPRLIAGLNSLTLENDGREPDVSKISYPVGQRMMQYGVGIGLRYSFNQ